jgi:hypothetical protein
LPGWREEWELLGFLPGPRLAGLLRAGLPADLDDSRTLEGAERWRKVRLAGLVIHGKEPEEDGAETLLDEFGLIDCDLPPGAEAPGEAELVLVEGTVEVIFGAPIVRASKISGWLPGVVSHPAAGASGAA